MLYRTVVNHSIIVAAYLEVSVNTIKAFRIFRQLIANIVGTDKNTLQMRPGSLHLEPN